jgi:hypothetical protein
MKVQLLVERDQKECVGKLAGTSYTFMKNEHGHFISEINSFEHIKLLSHPTYNNAFRLYSPPEKKVIQGRNDGIMETGQKAMGIVTPTTEKRADIEIKVPERIEGRPRATEPYQKVTVTLYERQILSLDKVALVIRERTGQAVSRAELIRAILDKAAGSLNPKAKDFDKNVRGLFPILNE